MQKSKEVMDVLKLNNLLKIAEQDECVMAEITNLIYNMSLETSSARNELNYYLDEGISDILKHEIEDKYAVYFDLEDEYSIRNVLEESEDINANCVEILDCIDKESFSFEDWGCCSDLDCRNDSFILNYDYDAENNDLIISVDFVSELEGYMDREAGIEPLRISINQLLTANHTNVA